MYKVHFISIKINGPSISHVPLNKVCHLRFYSKLRHQAVSFISFAYQKGPGCDNPVLLILQTMTSFVIDNHLVYMMSRWHASINFEVSMIEFFSLFFFFR